MTLQQTFKVLMALPVGLLILDGVALAHHSRTQYGHDETTTNGTVIEYQWKNPHVYLVWQEKDQGKTTHWVGEMSSVTSMIADGMTKDSLKPGDQITVVAFGSRNAGSTEVLVKKITKADGTVVVEDARAPQSRQR